MARLAIGSEGLLDAVTHCGANRLPERYILMAHVVMAYIVMAYIVMANVVMAYIVMVCIAMAYIVIVY